MARTLADLALSEAPLESRLAAVRALAAAVRDLHARGRIHGALDPGAVAVLEGGGVVLSPPDPGARAAPLARAGFTAPEVARGRSPSRRSDAFSLGALAYLALTGRAPFEADGALETLRRTLFEEPLAARLREPRVPEAVEAEIAALLAKESRRRGTAEGLLAAMAGRERSAQPTARPWPAETPPRTTGTTNSTTTPTSATATTPITALPATTPTLSLALLRRAAPLRRALAPALSRAAAAARDRLPALLPRSPLPRAGLAALPVVVLALVFMPGSDVALERDVAALVERGDHAGATALLDAAARERPDDPVIEKLRGDVACARSAPGECLRRYRVALAARPELREDEALRRNVRRLLGRAQGCGTRRAAAGLLGEIRDPGSLPSLEEARRSGGLLAFLCTGDSIDRAIAATREAAAGASAPLASR